MLVGLLLGHGRMGRLHARKLSARPDVRLVVHDPAQGLVAPRGLKPDFAVVATPTSTHRTLAGELLADGVPCLVEKPLAGTVHDAAALAELPGLAVGHSERFHPAVRALHEQLSGQRPRFLQARRLAPVPTAGPPEIDVVWDIMVHDLDLALAWMGPGWSMVRATGVGVLGGSLDLAEARVEWPHGVATFIASRVSPGRVRGLQLFTPAAYWSADLVAGGVHRRDLRSGAAPGPAVAVSLGKADALDAEHDAFLDMVRTGRAFPVGGPAGLAAVRLAAAVQRACAAGAGAPGDGPPTEPE